MHRFWDSIIEPILELLQPKSIVEIGCDQGKNTRNLLEFCKQQDTTLYAIDPLPKFDVASWQEQHGERLVFYQSLSLNALPEIDGFDAVLIDGDHNWYTVFNELRLIEKLCEGLNQHFPLIILHDIGWPYGRRDLYYNPENIPEVYRQPFEKKGMRPGTADLQEKDGLNATLFNSIYENNLQNGVLTAIEDFIVESKQSLELVKIPGLYGLGILYPCKLKEHKSDLAKFLEILKLPPVVKLYIEKIESERLETEIVRVAKGNALHIMEDRLKELADIKKKLSETKLYEQKFEDIKKKLSETIELYEKKLADTNKSLLEKERQLEVLQSTINQNKKDIEIIRVWIEQIKIGYSALLKSQRWKFGNTLGELQRRILFRPKTLMATDYIENILEKFDCWDEAYKKESGKYKVLNTSRKNIEISEFSEFQQYIIQTFLDPNTIKKPLKENDHYVLNIMNKIKSNLIEKYISFPQSELVSIIMPTYNRAAEISLAINSVLSQSYKNWELIIVDDGSKDNTENIVLKFDDLRIKYHKLNQNLGAATARNVGISKAKGNYICYLDSDDFWDKDFILIMVNELIASKNAKLAYSAQMVWSDYDKEKCEGKDLKAVRFSPFNRSLLENNNYISMISVIHNRELIDQYGGFDEKLKRYVDWDFFIRITKEIFPIAIPVCISHYLQNRSDNHISKVESQEVAIKHLMDKQRNILPLSKLLPDITLPELPQCYGIGNIVQTSYKQKVTIVIPSYEITEYLHACVDSIRKLTPNDYHIIIVDNCSGQECRKYLREIENDKDVTIIYNDKNYGFTYAVNQGIKLSDPISDIIILNNDALVTPGWLSALQEVAEKVDNIGLIAPRQVLLANTKTIKTHVPGANPVFEMDTNLSFHHNNVIDPKFNVEKGWVELSFAPFFCVYLMRNAIDKCGFLDVENGPHYCSDRLYCEYLRNVANMKIIYTPHSKVYHFHQRATQFLKDTNYSLYEIMYVKNDWDSIKEYK